MLIKTYPSLTQLNQTKHNTTELNRTYLNETQRNLAQHNSTHEINIILTERFKKKQVVC
jgi:hypothetical protein